MHRVVSALRAGLLHLELPGLISRRPGDHPGVDLQGLLTAGRARLEPDEPRGVLEHLDVAAVPAPPHVIVRRAPLLLEALDVLFRTGFGEMETGAGAKEARA